MQRHLARLILLLAPALIARASMVVPLTLDEQLHRAAAVCQGVVIGTECYKNGMDGHIYTRTQVRVDESFKGKLPGIVSVTHRGGRVEREGEDEGLSPHFAIGEEHLFFLSRRRDGTLFALQGTVSAPRIARDQAQLRSPADEAMLRDLRRKAWKYQGTGADVTDQTGDPPTTGALTAASIAASPLSTATNLLDDGTGVAPRFPAPDRGEAIPYLVDADALPSGVTLTQALTAVQQALAAWTNVTTVRYVFQGVQSFGAAAGDIVTDDGKLRIQLHDLYGYIPEPDVLGKGGRAYRSSPPSIGTWGFGGRVGNSEFHRTTAGYVVLKHTESSMRNLATLAEVLCHEIGHTLSMAHSSENPSEPWADWRQAIMYFQAHGDGRGATLGAYDPRVIGQVYPMDDTPPYCYDRVMEIVTQPLGAPNVAGVNEVEVRGYDLQSDNLTLQTAGSSTPEFSVVGSRIKYTPLDFYEAPRIDPSTGSYYDIVFFRYSDGTNASPAGSIRTIDFLPDNYPEFPDDSDGVPDDWMIANFGSPDPSDGPNREAGLDQDGDGYTNLQEFILGSNPTSAASNLRITSINANAFQFQAKPYELYEIHGSSNLVNWQRVGNPIVPDTSTGAATGYFPANGARFLRVLKVQ